MYWLPLLLALGMELTPSVETWHGIKARHCAIQLDALRFVSTPKGDRIPLYWDLKLAAYLTQAYRRARARDPEVAETVVIPLYAAEGLMFRQGAHLFVTTGMLERINDDAELTNQFRDLQLLARRRLRRQHVQEASACEEVLATGHLVFESVWNSLRESLVRYEEWTRPRLRVRLSNRGLAGISVQP